MMERESVNSGLSTLELSDYIEIALRRKWVILVCLLLGMAGSGGAFFTQPSIYRSSTLILVESQKVPTDIVKPVLVNTLEERLTTIKQQILSRTLLKKIIDEFGLYSEQLSRRSVEGVIEDMRDNIQIVTVGTKKQLAAFTIIYDGPDPVTVKNVTDKLASLFIEENLKIREQLIEGTTQFLEEELRRVEQSINRKEAAITEYRRKHAGSLPEQEDAHLRTLDRLQLELQHIQNKLPMLREKRKFLTAILSTSGDDTVLISTSGPDKPVPLQVRLQQLRQQFAKLQSANTDAHPDVLRAKREIEELETQLAAMPSNEPMLIEEEARSSGSNGEQRMVGQMGNIGILRNQELHDLSLAIEMDRKREEALKQEIKTFERRIAEMPIHYLELNLLERDYNNISANYQSLLDKKLEAQVAENLEKRQKGERFRIIDPANLPSDPIKPKPEKFFMLGGVAGLAMAAGLLWWMELRVLPFRRPEQMEEGIGLPVLATIPHMSGLSGLEDTHKSQSALPPPNGQPQEQESVRMLMPVGGRKSRQTVQAYANVLGTDQFRYLANQVIRWKEEKGIRTIAVTSSVAGEGKTFVATGLAVALARDYLEETILVDGDMLNPGVSACHDLHEKRGLADVLAGTCDLDAALYQNGRIHNLRILPAGMNDTDRFNMITNRRLGLRELFFDLKSRGPLVIVDTPPVLAMAFVHLYLESVDGVIFVVRAGRTPQSDVAQALKVGAVEKTVRGVVMNDLAILTPHQSPYVQYYQAHYPE